MPSQPLKHDSAEAATARRRDRAALYAVALLLALSTIVQAVLIARSPLPGLDAVRFVELAREIDTSGLVPALADQSEQPVYPVWLWMVHSAVVAALGPFSSSWAVAVRWAAALPLVLSVVPVYLAAGRLIGRRAALAGAVVFCVLPEIARLGADGISDSTHLLLFATAFCAVVFGFQARAVGRVARWFALAGTATGLAILTRAESLMILPALAATFAWLAWRCWHDRDSFGANPNGHDEAEPPAAGLLAAGLGCFSLGTMLVAGPYLAAIGATTPEAATARLLGRAVPSPAASAKRDASTPPARVVAETAASPAEACIVERTEWILPDGRPASFRTKDPSHSLRRRGWSAAAIQLGEELADVFGYIGLPVLLVGLWVRGRRVLASERFAQAYFALLAAVGVGFAAREGYLDARHLATLVVPCVGCLGLGLIGLGRWCALRKLGWPPRQPGTPLREPPGLTASLAVATIVVVVGLACAIQMREPLHAGRAAHRRAAEWLAARAAADGVVLDSRGWTGLYSGWKTYDYRQAEAVFADRRLRYVVVETDELGLDTARSRTLDILLRRAAEPATRFRDRRKQNHVVVFRWDAERFRDGRSRRLVAGSGRPNRGS